MGVGKVASRQAFKQTTSVTGGADKKLFKALKKAKVGKKVLAREILWLFGASFIAFIAGFLVYYLIGEFLTEVFVSYTNDMPIVKFYFWIFLFSLIGVYIARLIVWAIRMVTTKS